ncbi:MAG: methyltransferase RsmF C-terminal domain-like protein [Prevotella sp.]|jgi:16S rRNA C967 or C1407 C5-methylase (RsmB/RsmF family)/NOL1/NOP2/fmu family ribosome biogenesis protein
MSLPEEFVAQTRLLMGEERFSVLRDALEQPSPVSIRLNPLKADGLLPVSSMHPQRVEWCAEGWYLNARPPFTFDPLFHAGTYYVQEASSMFLSHVLRSFVHHPVSMLDLCAAPGGKTTCAFSALPVGSSLMSNEPLRQRAQILKENVIKFGSPDIIVTNNYAADYARTPLMFDVILTDVPCSGEGMFRKDGEAIEEWSLQNVKKCQMLQRQIVADIWPCLRPGGLLIYSTCTFNRFEDEDNVAWICQELGAEPLEIPVEESWNITGPLTGSIPVCRFIPGFTRGEGLFMAALRKPGESESNPKLSEGALKSLRVMVHGVEPDKVKGKNHIPDITKALMKSPTTELPLVNVDYQQAVAYLRHDSIVLPQDAPRGYVTVGYEGQALGVAKNIGNRANNLYPAEWRIKSTYVPEPFHVLEPCE